MPPAVTALDWIACAASLILVAWWRRDVCEQYPGIRSLCRGCFYLGIAGSLLPGAAASLPLFADCGPVPELAGALAGLVLTLPSMAVMAWLLTPPPLSQPLPSERLLLARLSALVAVLCPCVGGPCSAAHLPPPCS